jgi:predicted lysophospholipase L1 biosynthesis ABC-type transport system permease subunit
MSPDSNRLLAWYKQLANVVILVSLPIAGCSLAVAVAAGLTERKRPFSVLRLTDVSVAMLRRVVALETVVPLVLTATVSIAVGFLAAQLFLRAQLDQTLVAPGPQYYLIVALGLLAALAILGSTLPMSSRITGPDAAASTEARRTSEASACRANEIDVGGQDDRHGEGDSDRAGRALQPVRRSGRG